MKAIIAGSRSITDYNIVEEAIEASGWRKEITEVISGGAPGVDRLGEMWAKKNHVDLVIFPANWDKHGKKAGPIRNNRMAHYLILPMYGHDYSYAEPYGYLIAVWDGVSRGTKSMIDKAKKYGNEVYVHRI